MNMGIDLTALRIIEIRYPDIVYKLGKTTCIFDEGSFYRCDETYNTDKQISIRLNQ